MKQLNYVAQAVHDDCPDQNPRVDWDNLGHMVCAHSQYNLGDEQSSNPLTLGGYETDEENFYLWVFSEFMETVVTCPKILTRWYTDGYSPILVKDVSGGRQSCPQALLDKHRELIQAWMADNLCILPLYLYDHSGITMSTNRFNCPWDSGQVGYIYLTREKYEKETALEFTIKAAHEILTGEVETYDYYLTGEVYGKTLHRMEDTWPEDGDLRRLTLVESNPVYRLFEADSDYDIEQYDCQELDSCWGYFGHDYVRECIRHEFPDMCLSDAIGDYAKTYKVSSECIRSNGIVANAKATDVKIMSRDELFQAMKQWTEQFAWAASVEPILEQLHPKQANWSYM